MNYKSFNLGDWIGHISGVIEDETTLDGNEMRDLVEFLTTLNQQPCEDCISRQAVKDIICSGVSIDTDADKEYVCELIDKLPSVTPKEKTGRWISFGIQGEIDGQIVRAFTCSKCGAISIFRVSNGNIVNGDLCPNCGVKMQEVENDTN